MTCDECHLDTEAAFDASYLARGELCAKCYFSHANDLVPILGSMRALREIEKRDELRIMAMSLESLMRESRPRAQRTLTKGGWVLTGKIGCDW